MRNLTPQKEFRLKKQSIYELNFSDDNKTPSIHSRVMTACQPQETLFQAYMKNKVLKLKNTHHNHNKVQQLKLKLINIFKENNQQCPHDIYTDTNGKKILEELKQSHSININGLSRMIQSNEQNQFFLNQPRHSSVLRKCYYRYPVDAIERLEQSRTTATPSPCIKRYKPLLKPRQRKSEQWNELNAWQTRESNSNLF